MRAADKANTMKYLCLLLSILLLAPASAAGAERNVVRVSLLTAAPGTESYELFGHTGIRVVYEEVSPRTGETMRRDAVFNYGLFDFDAPHFLYRFTKGETDYSIGAGHYRQFIESYTLRGSTVYEQPLMLDSAEARCLLDALLVNMLPQNRIYRYNFLYDNCATRPRDKVEEALGGRIVYDKSDTTVTTFRRLIHERTRNHPWLTFGIDLALGAPLDRPVSYRNQMFLPAVLMQDWERASIVTPDGETRPLSGGIQIHALQPRPENPATPFTPVIVFSALLLAVVACSIAEYRRGCHARLLDYLIFGLYGLFGCVLFFLIFISIHPATSPNYSALWCHPLLWVAALCAGFAQHRRITVQLMSVVQLVTLAFFVAAPFLPQVFNPAFFPLAAIPAVRCITWIKVEQKRQRS